MNTKNSKRRLVLSGLSFAVLLLFISNYVHAENSYKNSFGFGIGLHYGIVGISYDRFVQKNLSITLSAGSIGNSESGEYSVYNVGAKYYLRKKTELLHPRVSVLLGNNAWGDYECWLTTDACSGRSYNGVTVGAGAAMLLGKARRHILDFDIVGRLFTLDIEDDKRAAIEAGDEDKDIWRIFFSLGYRYRF